MYPLLNGLFFGLVLAILVGPILFSLIQAGLEHGFKAGITIGLGVWMSDLMFIITVYWGVSYVLELTKWEGFEEYLGVGGGIVLIIIGVGTTITAPPPFDMHQKSTSFTATPLALWLKGFLVNTLNPFTVFFWVATMSTVVVDKEYSSLSAFLFFTGIMSVIVFTDTLKVYLAKLIRERLQYKHILRARQISGIALITFGVALMVRVFVF